MFAGFRSRCSTPRLMREIHRVADVEEMPQQLPQRQDPLARVAAGVLGLMEPLDGLLEGLALDEPHGVIRAAVGVAAQAIDRDDPRVLQPAGDLGLAHEPGPALRAVGVACLHLLQGDYAAQLPVVGFEDLAQPAPGVELADLVPRACGVGVGVARRGGLRGAGTVIAGRLSGGQMIGAVAVEGDRLAEDGLDQIGMFREPTPVFLRRRPLAGPAAVGQLQHQQLAEQRRATRLGHFAEVILDRRPPARLPGGLEAVAHRLHLSAQRVPAVPSLGRGRVAHETPSRVPEVADAPELALDGRRDDAQPRGDLGVGLALHLPDRHRPQRLVPQAVEQVPALVGHQGGELGGGLRAEQQLDVPLGLLPERPAPGRRAPGWRASRRARSMALRTVRTNRSRQRSSRSSSLGNLPRSARR